MHEDRDADDTIGKDYGAPRPLEQPAANGHPTNGSETSKPPGQNDDHAQTRADKAISPEEDSATGHERMTDDSYKEGIDDQGEEVVEAAEDTVMY